MEKCKKNITEEKPDKSGNSMLNNSFITTNSFFYQIFLFIDAHLLAEKNEEIKMLNSIILGLHKKLSAVMETDISEFEMYV